MRKSLVILFMLIGIATMILGVVYLVYALRKGYTPLYALLGGGGIIFFGFIISIVSFGEGRVTKKKKD